MQKFINVKQLYCKACGTDPICDRDVTIKRFTATCGNTDCTEHGVTDGGKVTRLQALQAWNKRQKMQYLKCAK